MPTTVTELEVQALQLTPEDRAHLADRLLASLSSDEGIDQAWGVEAEKRLAELESGAVAGIPIEDAIARARLAIR